MLRRLIITLTQGHYMDGHHGSPVEVGFCFTYPSRRYTGVDMHCAYKWRGGKKVMGIS